MFKRVFFSILAVVLIVFLVSFIFWQDKITDKFSQLRESFVEKWQDSKSTEKTDTQELIKNEDQASPNKQEDEKKVVEPDYDMTEFNLAKDRFVLTTQNVDQVNLQVGCDIVFNTEPFSQYVRFEQFNLGFDIPYNRNWGNEQYAITPYFQNDKNFEFGPMDKFEGCAWVRKYSLSIKEHAHVDQIKENAIAQGAQENDISVKIINGNPVVIYSLTGFCDSIVMEVVGASYNYSFSIICTSNIDQAKVELENIVKSALVLDKMLG